MQEWDEIKITDNKFVNPSGIEAASSSRFQRDGAGDGKARFFSTHEMPDYAFDKLFPWMRSFNLSAAMLNGLQDDLRRF